jgi:hypothetical protein
MSHREVPPPGKGDRPVERVLHVACCLLIVGACSGGAAGLCDAEELEVTWPATIERGGATTSERLSATLTPETVTPESFDSLATALVRGRSDARAVEWTVPAFNTDPGGIAVAHKASLKPGEVLRVTGALDVGGWGVIDTIAIEGARVGVEAGDFVAREASGTIAVLETAPVALRLDVTARDSAGSTIRVRGDARFGHRRERRRCSGGAHGSGRAN